MKPLSLPTSDNGSGIPFVVTTGGCTLDQVPHAVHNNSTTGDSSEQQQQQQQQQQQDTTQQVDFVGSSAAVKDLFSLPYTYEECSLSVAIHNVEGTLVFDRDPQLDAARGGSVEPQQPPKLLFSGTHNRKGQTRPLPDNNRSSKPSSVAERRPEGEGGEEIHDFSHALVALSSINQLNTIKATPPPNGTTSPKTRVNNNTTTNALAVVNSFVGAIEKLKQRDGSLSSSQHPLETSTRLGGGVHHGSVSTLRRMDCETTTTTTTNRNLVGLPRPDKYVEQHIPVSPEPREYLSWKFHDMRLWVGSDALILRGKGGSDDADGVHSSNNNNNSGSSNNNEVSLTVRIEDAHEMQALVKKHEWAVRTGAFLPDHQRSLMQQRGKPSYADAAIKNATTTTRKKKQHCLVTPLLEDGGEKKKQSDSTSSVSERTAVKSGIHTTRTTAATARGGEKTGGFSPPDLDEVKLQTCIVPSSTIPAFGLLDHRSASSSKAGSSTLPVTEPQQQQQRSLNSDTRPTVVSPVSTVLDAYLDNIMANVPQLALCLRERGFIQSVKLLETENIPSAFLHPSTMDTSKPFGVATDETEKVFSPQVMEMNAAALLKFLKLNCTRDNATYLLRREYGQTNIHLYDISSISALKQRKWIWWLAMMSCRFAHRLRNISLHAPILQQDSTKRRAFRQRERALLQNALELFEVLTDMDGSCHDSLAAGVRENLADTFLRGEEDSGAATTIVVASTTTTTIDPTNHHASSSPEPATSVSAAQHPYATLTVDALNKAHDHLSMAIKCLFPRLEAKIFPPKNHGRDEENHDEKGKEVSPKVSSIGDGTSSDESDNDGDGYEGDDDKNDLEVIASATQLFGLHEKIINVSLRLAEIHLRNYYSSSAMQALRAAARRIADCLGILNLLSRVDKINTNNNNSNNGNNDDRDKAWLRHVQMQYVWLWEHCGHFARSFAGDGLWRDRGHAAADDILIVLQDAESAFFRHKNQWNRNGGSNNSNNINLSLFCEPNPLSSKTHDSVNLHSLSGIVQTTKGLHERTKQQPQHLHQSPRTARVGFEEAREAMHRQKLLLREERQVIVAACLAYERAVHAFKELAKSDAKFLDKTFLSLLQQRLGDACNEAGKILLDQLRAELSHRIDNESQPSDDAAHALLASAEFWFLEALRAFEESNDLRNLVLLRCNLCQCYKLRANALFATTGIAATSSSSTATEQSTHAESCLQEAANQLECAHEALGERATDNVLWDMVSAELAATFLVLGVRRRQSLIGSGNTPMISQSLRLSPGQERSIVEPMDRALNIYQSNGNLHQAAAAHYQLALFFSKVWTCQRDETKTREKLAAAFTHYSAAHAFFVQAVWGNELTLCLVCLDLSNLYSSVQGEEGNAKALLCCLDTMTAMAALVGGGGEQASSEWSSSPPQPPPPRTNDWYLQMETVASSVEDRVFKLLRSLVKLFEDGETRIPYKDIYRASLKAKMMTQTPTSIGPQLVLDRLTNVYTILKATDEATCELGLK